MKTSVPSSAHTPGPWHLDWLDDDNAWILDPNGNYLFEVVTNDGEGLLVSKDEQLANARLVAIAPELLQAAKSMCLWFECLMDTQSWNGDKDDYMKLKAAIAKAESRT